MSDITSETRTRRALLGGAVAAAAAAAIGTFVHPETASATTGTMQYGVSQDAGNAATNLYSVAAGAPTILFGNDALGGYGVIGEATAAGGVGVYGHGFQGTGIVGAATPGDPPVPGGLVGVFGYSTTGTAVVAETESGTALRVTGKAVFNRSGRASVPKGRSYVDVDLTMRGGLGGTPLAVATINTRRAGVHIETVRVNYPVAGKLRIYLNKVASSTSSTSVSWIVLA